MITPRLRSIIVVDSPIRSMTSPPKTNATMPPTMAALLIHATAVALRPVGNSSVRCAERAGDSAAAPKADRNNAGPRTQPLSKT